MAKSKTLRGNIDGWTLAAEIRVERQVHKGTFLIVEGDHDDKVLSRFTDENKCQIVVAFGKKNALEALDLLEEEGFPGVVTIVDADFDRLSGSLPESPNVLVTEFHDLDIVLLESRALDIFLRERANEAKLEKAGGTVAVRSILYKTALPLGYIRWLSEKNKLRINFNLVKFDFIDQSRCICDEDELLRIIEGASYQVTRKALEAGLKALRSPDHDVRQVCNGHDVMEILGESLREFLADIRDARSWASEVAKGIRLAFDYEEFKNTLLCEMINNWQVENKPYFVLKRS